MSEPFRELVRRARSIRRFRQDRPLDLATLRSLVDLARLSASGGNRQPLKYILSSAPDVNAGIFACLRWAAHLRDWP
ncbi:MAG TPA: nitroreductase family protein, partial [Desulfobacterales bacterium]|nr:nitroreductase family protein [Desulfobacterales bacterium]